MYLSTTYMRSKSQGQKLMLYVLSYLDGYIKNTIDSECTIGAISNTLKSIESFWPEMGSQYTFDYLFVLNPDNEMFIHEDRFKELCNLLRTRI